MVLRKSLPLQARRLKRRRLLTQLLGSVLAMLLADAAGRLLAAHPLLLLLLIPTAGLVLASGRAEVD